MNEELRLYSFCNFYLSSIQQGIQTGHLAVDMAVNYADERMACQDDYITYWEWAERYKTFIVLNGGDSESIYTINIELRALCIQLNLPYGQFNEPGCNGMITCTGAVIPARYFNAKKELWPEKDKSFYIYEPVNSEKDIYFDDSLEYQLIELIKSKPLAK